MKERKKRRKRSDNSSKKKVVIRRRKGEGVGLCRRDRGKEVGWRRGRREVWQEEERGKKKRMIEEKE